MKLRHLIVTAAVATLAVSPLAATAAASAAFNAHSERFDDTTKDGHIVGTIDVTKVHVYRTTKDYRAVVSYKDLTARPGTRWITAFADSAPSGKVSRAIFVEYRISPEKKTAVIGYRANSTKQGKVEISQCRGFVARPDYAASTITFTVANKCWPLTYAPAQVFAATRLYTKDDPYTTSITGSEDKSGNHSDQAQGTWSWGGKSAGAKAHTFNPLSF